MFGIVVHGTISNIFRLFNSMEAFCAALIISSRSERNQILTQHLWAYKKRFLIWNDEKGIDIFLIPFLKDLLFVRSQFTKMETERLHDGESFSFRGTFYVPCFLCEPLRRKFRANKQWLHVHSSFWDEENSTELDSWKEILSWLSTSSDMKRSPNVFDLFHIEKYTIAMHEAKTIEPIFRRSHYSMDLKMQN